MDSDMYRYRTSSVMSLDIDIDIYRVYIHVHKHNPKLGGERGRVKSVYIHIHSHVSYLSICRRVSYNITYIILYICSLRCMHDYIYFVCKPTYIMLYDNICILCYMIIYVVLHTTSYARLHILLCMQDSIYYVICDMTEYRYATWLCMCM